MTRKVESGSPEAERLLRAHELISAYVTHGAMDTDDQFDEWFGELAALVPRDLVRPVSVVHRAVTIPATDLEAIRAGGTAMLRPRRYGSRSRSADAALRCLRGRFPGMAAMVVTKPVDGSQIVVDVREVYAALSFDDECVEEWDRYVSWEDEVIVRQDPSMLAIVAADVTVAHLPGDRDALRPLVGERAWSDEDGDMPVIDHVPRDQPGQAEGLWSVELADRGPAKLSWDHRHSAWQVASFEPEAEHGQEPDDDGPDATPAPRFG